MCAIGEDRVYAWRLLPLMPEERKTKPPQEKLIFALFEHLEELMNSEPVEAAKRISVVIENQPSRINGVMKTVQTWIQTYFMLRKYWGENVEGVHLLSAAQKLKGHAHEPVGAKGKVNTYKYNKSAAVVITRAYIADDPTLRGCFDAHKKRDDLADAFLHAVAWVRREGLQAADVRAFHSGVESFESVE